MSESEDVKDFNVCSASAGAENSVFSVRRGGVELFSSKDSVFLVVSGE